MRSPQISWRLSWKLLETELQRAKEMNFNSDFHPVCKRPVSSYRSFVRSFVLILTRNNGSKLKTSAWGVIPGENVGLMCGYTLCDRPPALPDWLSGDLNAVVHDSVLHSVMEEVRGARVLL